ncbi:MAG: hypothetical protein NTZ69_05945 [Bacteroidia bacterium]|nr:hypothetical protein [Bacteroidia bacterium]
MSIKLLILTLFLSLTFLAQGKRRNVVYLKNGTVLRGTIVLHDPGKLIQLRTADNNLWVFKMDQIDSIAHPVRVVFNRKTGYFNLTELGFLQGSDPNARLIPRSLLNISQWKFENGLAPGIGFGIEYANEAYLPVVADIRYYLRDKQPMPYFSFQAGYSIPLDPHEVNSLGMSSVYNSGAKARGGFLLNPAIGIQTPLNENLALTFSAGYRWMKYHYSGNNNYQMDFYFNRLSLKIGLLFK